ncbi:MAG: hypothetical protein H0X05_05135 [Actinobacteria bacterium]|nr:hypothetical protein [Actinomycetota bacterium]
MRVLDPGARGLDGLQVIDEDGELGNLLPRVGGALEQQLELVALVVSVHSHLER